MMVLTTKEKWLLALSLFVVFLYSFNALKDSDSFYHIKTGQVILETKSIPHADIFSQSAAGAPWVTHEWLAELIFWGIYALTGFWGLMAAIALLATATHYLLFRIALNRGANFYITLIMLLALGYLTFELWIPRPQIFSYFLFVALLFCLECIRSSVIPVKTGIQSANNMDPRIREDDKTITRWMLYAIGVLWLWANTNASVILGIVLLAWFAGYVLWEKKLAWRSIVIALFAGIAVVFINPNGYHVLTYFAEIKAGAQALHILEWQPITAFLYRTETKIFIGELVLGLLFILFWYGRRKESRDLFLPGLALGIAVLPFISIRHVAFWPLATTPFLAAGISGVLQEKMKDSIEQLLSSVLLIFALAMALGRIGTFPRTHFDEHTVPVYAADFIEQNQLRGPLFHLYNEGGYFIWRFWPKEKIFIDGRSEVFVGRPTEEFFEITGGFPLWEKLVDEKYHFNYMALAYRPDSLAKSILPLLKKLVAHHWSLVYWDDSVLIYVRPVKENADIINRFALHHIHPLRDPASIPDDEQKAAAKEIQDLLARSPHSIVVQNYAQAFLEAHP